MIVFKTLRFRNILSTGDTWSTIDLSDARSTLIVGDNGSGKSTLLDALSFVLFSKPHRRINKPQLVNSVNDRGLEVEIEFTTRGADYKIRRGIKPAVFEIHKNGKAIDQLARAVDYQSVLENNILGMSYKAFNQIVVLGASSFTPFMQLTAQQRRDVIEDLLDINIFSRMNDLLKQDMAKVKEAIGDASHQVALTQTKLDAQEVLIAKIKASQSEAIEDSKGVIAGYRQEIAALQEANKGHDSARAELATVTAARDREATERDKFAAYKRKFNLDIADLAKRAAFFRDNSECPTCAQTISPASKAEHIGAVEAKQAKLRAALADIATKLTAAQATIETHNTAIEAVQTRISTYHANQQAVANLERQIGAVERRIESLRVRDDVEAAVADQRRLAGELAAHTAQRAAAKEEQEYGLAIARMLKDDGIRSKIIQESLPLINKTINQHLHILELPIKFGLNATFSETIGARHRENHSYMSLSEGERMRVDLSILFAWRLIAKRRATVDCNLMVLRRGAGQLA